MSARLYNHTCWPDDSLKPILNWAARVAGVRDDVPVKVTHSDKLRPGAVAHRNYPYRKTLIGRPTTSTDKRTLKCGIGWVELHLPRQKRIGTQGLYVAEWFVDVAVHEMAHVYQFREHESRHTAKFWGNVGGTKRQRHDSRPCEIHAENTVDGVRGSRAKDQRRQELAIELALVLEANDMTSDTRGGRVTYRLQRSDHQGVVSRAFGGKCVSWSPWRTVGRFESLVEAAQHFNVASRVGLSRWRVMHGTTVERKSL